MFSVVLSPLAPWTRLLITWLLLRLTQLGTTCGLVLRSVCAFFGPVLSRSASETAREQATSCLEVLLSNVEHIIPPPTYHRPTTDRPRDSLPCDHRGAANRQRRDRHVVLLHFGSALLHHSGERFDSGGVVAVDCLRTNGKPMGITSEEIMKVLQLLNNEKLKQKTPLSEMIKKKKKKKKKKNE